MVGDVIIFVMEEDNTIDVADYSSDSQSAPIIINIIITIETDTSTRGMGDSVIFFVAIEFNVWTHQRLELYLSIENSQHCCYCLFLWNCSIFFNATIIRNVPYDFQ